MTQWMVDISLIAVVAAISWGPRSVIAALPAATPAWRLAEYLEVVQSKPLELMELARKLFSPEAIAKSQKDPAHAHAWQDRLAMLSALSHLFDPALEKQGRPHWGKAAQILEHAMIADPSLLVRDGAVEAMRRINRMRPGYITRWQKTLESAFLSQKNQSSGEGYFIRETILAAMREASLKPSSQVRQSAQGDTNPRVRSRLDEWNTSAF